MKPADNNKFVTFCLDPYFAIILGLSFSEDMESQYSLFRKKFSEICRWESQGPERLTDLLKFTQLSSFKARL